MAISWALIAERTEGMIALADKVERSGDNLVVPAIWPVEVSNVIWANVHKRKRLTIAEAEEAIALLLGLSVDVEPIDQRRVFSSIYPLAILHGLTTYDAMYLELAHRLRCPLLTNDDELIRAAGTIGVRLFT